MNTFQTIQDKLNNATQEELDLVLTILSKQEIDNLFNKIDLSIYKKAQLKAFHNAVDILRNMGKDVQTQKRIANILLNDELKASADVLPIYEPKKIKDILEPFIYELFMSIFDLTVGGSGTSTGAGEIALSLLFNKGRKNNDLPDVSISNKHYEVKKNSGSVGGKKVDSKTIDEHYFIAASKLGIEYNKKNCVAKNYYKIDNNKNNISRLMNNAFKDNFDVFAETMKNIYTGIDDDTIVTAHRLVGTEYINDVLGRWVVTNYFEIHPAEGLIIFDEKGEYVKMIQKDTLNFNSVSFKMYTSKGTSTMAYSVGSVNIFINK